MSKKEEPTIEKLTMASCEERFLECCLRDGIDDDSAEINPPGRTGRRRRWCGCFDLAVPLSHLGVNVLVGSSQIVCHFDRRLYFVNGEVGVDGRCTDVES